MSPLLLPATCLLAVSETTLNSTDDGWLETGHHEVVAESRCPWVDIVLPAGSTIDHLKAKVRLADGGRRRIDDLRQVVVLPTPGEPERLRLLTPDVLAGDSVWIDLTRTLPAADYTWSPGAQRGRYASLDSDVAFAFDDSTSNSAWTDDAAELAPIAVVHPSPTAAPVVRSLPAEAANATLTQILVVPGDPQRTLYPGGGSSVDTTWTLSSAGQPDPAAVVVPVPSDATDVEVTGPHVRGLGSVTLWLDDEPVEHTVRYHTADAPTYGVRASLPGASVTHRVDVEGGRVRWEDDRRWWLASMGITVLTPEHRRLLSALGQRFARAALPEPAVPVHLRGLPGNADTVERLRLALHLRAGVAPLDTDPLFPRRLVKARKSGALTSVEAALILVYQLGQLDVRSTWAVVDPGPPDHASWVSPEGYTEGLVVVATAEGPAFVDPGCGVCAGFEVRPHLQGTRMLSPAGDTGPAIVEGRSVVTDANGKRHVRLEGPAALTLRLAVSELRKDARTTWLTHTFGGPDATFDTLTGLGTLGSPIDLNLTLGEQVPDGRFLLGPDWVGERRWVRSGGPDDRHVHQDDLCSLTRSDGPLRIDVVTVNDPHVLPDAWTEFQMALTPPSLALPAPGVPPTP